MARTKRYKDLTGKTFGRLTILGRAKNKKSPTPRWHYRCSCGKTGITNTGNLTRNNSLSCGCLRKEKATTHGFSRHPLWQTFKDMHYRCESPKCPIYKNYGARGISVCARWSDFITFTEDMGDKPTSAHSIERIDNSKGYSPENCIWATATTQHRNTRRNHILVHDGKALCISEWADITGIALPTLFCRINTLGWDTHKALTTPVKRK